MNNKQMLRFQAKITGTDSEGNMEVELKITHKLNREDGLRYAKENGIPIPNPSEFKGLDITDPYTINTKKKNREEALQMINEFITDFTKTLDKEVGKATLIDMKTGKLVGSESNINI